MNSKIKFLCVQTGARRGYAVPKILADADMLSGFYTDIAGNVGIGRLAGLLKFNHEFSRLANRKVPEKVVPVTTIFPTSLLIHKLQSSFGGKDEAAKYIHGLNYVKQWSKEMIRSGFGNATHLYSMLNEGADILAEAKRRRITVISEIYIILSAEKIVDEERKKYPDWEPESPHYQAIKENHFPDDDYPRGCDLCICPSPAVQDDLVQNWQVSLDQTVVVPYGMDPRWLETVGNAEYGRVLFVGTAELRKGIHYLAWASQILRQRGFKGEFRVAGGVSEQVKKHSACQHLTFIGRIPRSRIEEEFRKADIFVLPSLAEGSAEVTYESLAAGVPQIVTKAAGSVAKNGSEGFVVPERDPKALADAIEEAVRNRTWRATASKRSRELARSYTWNEYSERLMKAILNFQNRSPSSKTENYNKKMQTGS